MSSLLEDRIGHSFKQPELLRDALTHSSVGSARNYERLEFLGDRVLGLAIAQILYQAYPQENEGDLAKRHAALVQGKTLAKIAREMDLGNVMIFSDAERGAGGADNDNILADGLEAVIGALYLDAGFAFSSALIGRFWNEAVKTMSAPPQDAKTALQEWAQGRGLPLPLYEIAGREGPDHAPVFDVRVSVQGFAPVSARGSSRRGAEKDAASQLLAVLQGQAS